MKPTHVVSIFSVVMGTAMVCAYITWRDAFSCVDCDVTHFPSNDPNPGSVSADVGSSSSRLPSEAEQGNSIPSTRLAAETSDAKRPYQSESLSSPQISSNVHTNTRRVSWENCRQCPAVTEQKKGAKWTVACKGSENNMTVIPKQSFVDLSPQECASICSCPGCETCDVKAEPFQKAERVGNRLIRHFTGSSGFILLLFNDSHGTTYVAKIGRDKRSKKDTTNEGLLIAQQKVRDECGFQDIVPREYIGPLKAHFEGDPYSYITSEQVIFSERFLGQEIEKMGPHTLGRLNGTQLTLAALHDYLIGERRAFHNALRQADRNIKLIDNHAECMQSIANSMFVPGTGFWNEKRTASYTKKLDYRCSIPGRSLKKNYPPSVQRCLDAMSKSTVEDLANKFGISPTQAFHLHERVMWMLEGGFEYAINKSLQKYEKEKHLADPKNPSMPAPSCL